MSMATCHCRKLCSFHISGCNRVELFQVEVRMRTRVHVSLSAGTAAGSYAAWAGIFDEESSGVVPHAAYLGTRLGSNATADDRSSAGAGNFSTSTVWLGNPAARRTEQSKWYYVSSVITGTVDEQSAPMQHSSQESQGASPLAGLCLLNRFIRMYEVLPELPAVERCGIKQGSCPATLVLIVECCSTRHCKPSS